ncbi:hypothetical protein CTA1_4108 [Colletotrichum tanaceti]|uniref:NAD-specific glutamate dehydrogenase n=1 Tax=Colletotrichum tanaceti TaxID=1306861 RepID=A0A4U6XIZ8_9PEZI|nr:hypothetical protein CTA1_4108 [Colletotrichum tanaceti]
MFFLFHMQHRWYKAATALHCTALHCRQAGRQTGRQADKTGRHSRLDLPLDRGQSQQTHAVVEHGPGSRVQCQAGLLDLWLASNNAQVVVTAADDVREAEQVGQHSGGLQRLERVLDNVGVLADDADQLNGMLLRQQTEVGLGHLLLRHAGLAEDGAQPGVGVLEVRSGVALERGHGVHVELVVVDPRACETCKCTRKRLLPIKVRTTMSINDLPLAAHVLDHDTADAKDVGRGLRVLDLVVLGLVLPHHLVHLVADVAQDIVEELDGALARAHAENHAKVDVLALLRRLGVAHQLDDLEELLQVQVLLRGDDVDHVVKAVLFLAVQQFADVSRQVQRRAVLLADDGALEALAGLSGNVLGEVDDDGALRLLRDLHLLELLGGGLHVLLRDLALARVLVKVDVEAGVRLLVAGDAEIAEAPPLRDGGLVAGDHGLEVFAGLLVEAVVLEGRDVLAGLLLGGDLLFLVAHGGVDLDIDLVQVVDGVLLEGVLAAEAVEAESQQAVLLAPIAEVVDAGDIPAGAVVEVGDEAADDGASQMAGVEGLRNVGGGELDDDLLLAQGRVLGVLEAVVGVLAEGLAAGADLGDEELGERTSLEPELEEGAVLERHGLLDEGRLGELQVGAGGQPIARGAHMGGARRVGGRGEVVAAPPLARGISCAHILEPLGCELGGLLALDAQRRHRQDQVALVEALGPLEGIVDDGLFDACHIVQQ